MTAGKAYVVGNVLQKSPKANNQYFVVRNNIFAGKGTICHWPAAVLEGNPCKEEKRPDDGKIDVGAWEFAEAK